LMILNVDAYVDVFLERSLRADEGHIGVDESLMINEGDLDTDECLFSVNEQQKV